MGTTFRAAAAADSDALVAMMRGLYGHDRIAFDEAAARAALAQLLADERFGLAHLILVGGEVAGYVILVTTAPRGTIPTDLWRKAHVIHL